jgi:hypothetical protein
MTEKKAEQKLPFDPIQQGVADSFDVHFFGDKHFNIQKFCAVCRKRGLVGLDVWTTQKALSAPLKLFLQESRDLTEDQIDAFLNGLAATIGFDANLIKRHYYALKFQVEGQFLAALELAEEKRKKLERLAEEAESEAPEKEETEEEGEDEE